MSPKTPSLILVAALLLPLGAFAAEATPPKAEPAAEARQDPPDAKADANASRAARRKAQRQADAACDTTASRIRRNRAGECVPSSQPTRSYSKDDIDNTGQTDIAEALRRLDPRFQ